MDNKSNFREIIMNSAGQLSADLEFFNQLYLTRKTFNKVLFCGMGGSALTSDLFKYFKSRNFEPLHPNIPILVHRNYSLPAYTDPNTLVVCISYSGNTEETVSAFQKAKELNLEVAGIVSGGKLADLFNENKTPWIKLPSGLPPRLSIGYQLAAITKILMAYGLLPFSAFSDIKELSTGIEPGKHEADAKKLAAELANKIPVIYSSQENKVFSRIWKIKFNENTKIPAFFNTFPELNHNEMNGWSKNIWPFQFLFMDDEEDYPEIKKRMQVTGEMLKSLGYPVSKIKVEGGNPLQKAFSVISYGDWLSYYLALNYDTDPFPVEIVEEFKKRLKSK